MIRPSRRHRFSARLRPNPGIKYSRAICVVHRERRPRYCEFETHYGIIIFRREQRRILRTVGRANEKPETIHRAQRDSRRATRVITVSFSAWIMCGVYSFEFLENDIYEDPAVANNKKIAYLSEELRNSGELKIFFFRFLIPSRNGNDSRVVHFLRLRYFCTVAATIVVTLPAATRCRL